MSKESQKSPPEADQPMAEKGEHKNYHGGFTLVELLVVASIMIILGSLSLVNYRTGQARYSMSEAAQRLVSDLRRVQNLAASSINVSSLYCGYGIAINKSVRPYSYRIYGDKSPSCGSSNNKYDGSDDIIEEVALLRGIKIGDSSPSPLDIFFKPPDPSTYINQNNSLGVSATITLSPEGYSFPPKIIEINTSGLIQVQ